MGLFFTWSGAPSLNTHSALLLSATGTAAPLNIGLVNVHFQLCVMFQPVSVELVANAAGTEPNRGLWFLVSESHRWGGLQPGGIGHLATVTGVV